MHRDYTLHYCTLNSSAFFFCLFEVRFLNISKHGSITLFSSEIPKQKYATKKRVCSECQRTWYFQLFIACTLFDILSLRSLDLCEFVVLTGYLTVGSFWKDFFARSQRFQFFFFFRSCLRFCLSVFIRHLNINSTLMESRSHKTVVALSLSPSLFPFR